MFLHTGGLLQNMEQIHQIHSTANYSVKPKLPGIFMQPHNNTDSTPQFVSQTVSQ